MTQSAERNTTVSIPGFALGFMILVLNSCIAAGPRTGNPPKPTPVTWCDIQKSYLDELGLLCSNISGQADIMEFGIKNQNLRMFTDCITDSKAETFGVRRVSDGVAFPEYNEDWSSNFTFSAGLDLRKVSPWLPNADVNGKKGQSFRVQIKVESPEFIKISDPSQIFRDRVNNYNLTRAEKDRIGGCLSILCDTKSFQFTQLLVGFPEITFSSDESFSITDSVGWKTENLSIGADSTVDAKQNKSVKMVRKEGHGKVVVGFQQIASRAQFERDNLCPKSP